MDRQMGRGRYHRYSRSGCYRRWGARGTVAAAQLNAGAFAAVGERP